jgi:hypothetical protein
VAIQDERVISLLHSELVRAVQAALANQLIRDGKAEPDQELGLTFYALAHDQLEVLCAVRAKGRTLLQMRGGPSQLAAVAASEALKRLSPAERQRIAGDAIVRWRLVQFSGGGEAVDRFFADVTFSLTQS